MSSQRLDRDFCCHDSATQLEPVMRIPVPIPLISTVDNCVSVSRLGLDTSVSMIRIATDNEKSSFFENLLFDVISRRVLERNKRLFQELSKY